MIPEIWSAKQRLSNSFALVHSLPWDEEVLANWARYLCVLTSGMVEFGVREILSEYAQRQSSPEVSRFVDSRLKNLTNLNSQRIKDVLACFSPAWASAFEIDIRDEKRDAIDSIVANRNNIVHGSSVGISFVVVQRYFEQTWQVIEWLHALILST